MSTLSTCLERRKFSVSNQSYLVLIHLSAALDTIDHDTFFVILEKYVGITGSALQLSKSYFQTDHSEC